ncbi:hypothetical protein SK128_013558 [Halocaridina rubra]|uniref:Uncharacterized protein n=1 Tax=Halocaridina rubra TaxID=373956 RepID=A0AAN8XG89_HALRR
MMNGIDSGDLGHVDDEEGVRRSLRRRKYKSFDQSWLVGNKKLRGYPTMVPSSEPENEEARPARKLSRRLSSETVMVSRSRRSSRFHSVDSMPRRRGLPRYSTNSGLISPPTKSKRPNRITSPNQSDEGVSPRNRRSIPPQRYREENSDEEEESRIRTRRNNKRFVNEEKDEKQRPEKLESDQELVVRETRAHGKHKEKMEEASDDTKTIIPKRRIRTRSTTEVTELKTDDDEEDDEEKSEGDEDEEDEEDSKPQTRMVRRKRDPNMARDLSHTEFVDLYSRVKRERRPVKRFMYEDEVKSRSVIKRASSSSESDDKDDEEEEDEDAQMRSPYSLRQNRRESRPFQVDSPGTDIVWNTFNVT